MSTAPARRVLVVEHDREIRGVVSAALSRERYVVTEAADGNAAIAACRRADPDVIVLDLGLPQLATFATEYRKDARVDGSDHRDQRDGPRRRERRACARRHVFLEAVLSTGAAR